MTAAMKFVPERVAVRLRSALGGESMFLDDDDLDQRRDYLERNGSG